MNIVSPNGRPSLFTRLLLHLWWHLPAGKKVRERLKNIAFSHFSLLFKNSSSFKSWELSKELLRRRDVIIKPSDFPAHWPMEPLYLSSKNSRDAKPASTSKDSESLAIIIHAFYPDVLVELMGYLQSFSNVKCKLFVGTTPNSHKTVESILLSSPFPFCLKNYENRGRDILPFLKLATLAINEGHRLILKLHTKKSRHRLSGALWRQEIYKQLLDRKAVERILQVFDCNSNLGILGPAGHIIPMKTYYGSNALAICYLSHRLQFPHSQLMNLDFVGGSMFYMRSAALKPLLYLNLPDSLFEDERGQHDGTFAHAVERIFPVCSKVAGFVMGDSNSLPRKIKKQTIFRYRFSR